MAPTDREVRVGSKTDRLPEKNWETGVLAGRRHGADRGVKESVDSAGNGGETKAKSTEPRRRATGDENRTLRVGPLELILRGALLHSTAKRSSPSPCGAEALITFSISPSREALHVPTVILAAPVGLMPWQCAKGRGLRRRHPTHVRGWSCFSTFP